MAQSTLGTVPLVGFGTHELQGFGASGYDRKKRSVVKQNSCPTPCAECFLIYHGNILKSICRTYLVHVTEIQQGTSFMA